MWNAIDVRAVRGSTVHISIYKVITLCCPFTRCLPHANPKPSPPSLIAKSSCCRSFS